MIVHGRERKFLLTIGASAAIADLCPDGELSRLDEVLDGSFSKSVRTTAKLIAAMSMGYEQAKAFEEPGYEPCPMTEAEILALTALQLKELQAEALAAFKADTEKTVETEPSKKEKALA